jgi:hypothetical protein
LPPQEVVENVDGILASFKVKTCDVEDEVMQKVGIVRFLGELGDEFWRWI